VNHRIEATQRIDLRGDVLCPGDGLDIANYDRFSFRQSSSGVPSTGSIAGMQDNFVPLADEPIGGHEAETSG
jgi:hypothetical protein